MFRRRCCPRPGRCASPHARGDVPSANSYTRSTCAFSPRPWGCSGTTANVADAELLLPTPVGMFRWCQRTSETFRSSPHARGDVPRLPLAPEAVPFFSPRPWGCSADGERNPPAVDLLPTPVGMFRAPRPARPTRTPSPHARGDVPSAAISSHFWNSFSPRPWGCSDTSTHPNILCRLLPTPVGMFRSSDHQYRVVSSFSPRPWGCSVFIAHAHRAPPLLPTPVGMFRSATSSTASSPPSPHARGDVPRS